jgi:hypothetical protein
MTDLTQFVSACAIGVLIAVLYAAWRIGRLLGREDAEWQRKCEQWEKNKNG